MGDHVDVLLDDWNTVVEEGRKIGLVVNASKCELITDDLEVVSKFQSVAPDHKHVSIASATLLGAPIGGERSNDDILSTKLQELQRLSNRLTLLEPHDALFLLKTVSPFRNWHLHTAQRTLLQPLSTIRVRHVDPIQPTDNPERLAVWRVMGTGDAASRQRRARHPTSDGHRAACVPVVSGRVTVAHLRAAAAESARRRRHQRLVFHHRIDRVADPNRLGARPAAIRHSAEGIGCAVGECPGGQSVVSCTWLGGQSPSNCGCCTTLRGIPACTSLCGTRNPAWTIVATHRRRPAARRSCLLAARLCLWSTSRQHRTSRAQLQQVRGQTVTTQRSQRPHQACTDVGRSAVSTGATVSRPTRQQASGRLVAGPVEKWQMSGMGLHMSGHTGSKSHQHCRQWTWKRRHRGRRPEETQVRRLEFDVQLCSSRCGDTRCFGGGCWWLCSRTWEADHSSHWRAPSHRVFAVAAQCRYSARQCQCYVGQHGRKVGQAAELGHCLLHVRKPLSGVSRDTPANRSWGGGVQSSAHGPFIGLSKRFWNFSNISSNARDKMIVILVPTRLLHKNFEYLQKSDTQRSDLTATKLGRLFWRYEEKSFMESTLSVR